MSVNYRLGALGFLALEELSKSSKGKHQHMCMCKYVCTRINVCVYFSINIHTFVYGYMAYRRRLGRPCLDEHIFVCIHTPAILIHIHVLLAEGVSGNFGLMDIALALKWVRRTIQVQPCLRVHMHSCTYL